MNASRLAAAVCLLGIVVVLGAAGEKISASKEKLAGTWVVAKGEILPSVKDGVLTLSKDGKAKLVGKKNGQETTSAGTFSGDGGLLTLALEARGTVLILQFRIRKLTVHEVEAADGGNVVQLKRKS
jgi:uncharacterized protein (TIGR03066 family)